VEFFESISNWTALSDNRGSVAIATDQFVVAACALQRIENFRSYMILAMDGCFGPRDLEALQNLICPPKDDSDVEDDLPQAGARKLGEFKLHN